MIETALPTTNFAENAGMTVSRVSAVSWCFARNIYRKGEQIKMIENEMTVSVPLEVVKASEIEPKEVKWLWYPYIPFGKVTLLQGDPGDGKSKLMLSIAALLSNGEPRRRMLPDYGTVSMKGTQYYRNRVTDQQGRRVSLYARRL